MFPNFKKYTIMNEQEGSPASYETNPFSNCCEAEIIATGLGLICTKCNKPCDMRNNQTTMSKTVAEIFESGAMLHRNLDKHEQMLMNKGTFIELAKQYAKQQVEAALPIILQEAADQVRIIEVITKDRRYETIDKSSILNLEQSEELKQKLGI